jgi:hypothetical protein
LAAIFLISGCSGQEGVTEQTDESARDDPSGALQRSDETVLVQLGRTYSHSFPAGFYQEYALNDANDQSLTITLAPSGKEDMALTIARADDPATLVLDLDEFAGGEVEEANFMPAAGVNYRIRVYEVSGGEGDYQITIMP